MRAWRASLSPTACWAAMLALSSALAVGTAGSYAQTNIAAATSLGTAANLPIEHIGPNDLIGVTVYDSPELTRTFRIDANGALRLPMLHQHIQAAGLYPEQLEAAITKALVENGIFVDPVVTVSVVEYRSRPINVVGAVRNPVTVQDTGNITLLDALAQAGGLTEDAGQEILVSRQTASPDAQSASLLQRIPVSSLFGSVDPAMNVPLRAGDVVRVPASGRFYVVGNVKNPGAFVIKEGTSSSVFRALALTQGLDRYYANIAYIYRAEGGAGSKGEIPVPLKKIMKRKAPDVPLIANDVLYIPQSDARKATFTTLGRLAIAGVAVGTTLLYIYR